MYDDKIITKIEELKKSKFRSKFFLDTNDLNYIKKKGIEKIEDDARNFIEKRLKEAEIKNDGRQTPYKGHPVFKAQHATATCCRKCLEKWHKIKKNKREVYRHGIPFS
ncbi:MAG TPA: DUF4186 family protein [bacterium]|nr:DUF4186 family protein [bacterium]HOL48531.1 DUF4186 family protein [bacterium]HPQ19983.1 DUF4186 family protein [bacterium]